MLINTLMHCSKALPTAELITGLNTWDLYTALKWEVLEGWTSFNRWEREKGLNRWEEWEGLNFDRLMLLSNFFDWFQREV